MSLLWLCKLISKANLPNDAGKLPISWEQDKEDFLVRAAYFVLKYNVPDVLFVNMDETPLNHIASTSKTWAKTNSVNVSVYGGKDKRQATATPWINLAGTILSYYYG